MRRFIPAAVVSIALAACMADGEGAQNALWARLAAANLLAGSIAQGLASSIGTEDGQVALGPSRAALIAKSLDAVELSLDAAGDALRGGLPTVAAGQIGAAESQLDHLVPLLPADSDLKTGGTE